MLIQAEAIYTLAYEELIFNYHSSHWSNDV